MAAADAVDAVLRYDLYGFAVFRSGSEHAEDDYRSHEFK